MEHRSFIPNSFASPSVSNTANFPVKRPQNYRVSPGVEPNYSNQ